MSKEITDLKIKLREAVANYMQSEGCHCCENIDEHKEHTEALARLLNVKKYSDGSGYDFGKYKSKPLTP